MSVPVRDLPPSPMQVAHDLKMQAKALDGRHLQGVMQDQLCRSLRRGAATIEHLVKIVVDSEMHGFASKSNEKENARLIVAFMLDCNAIGQSSATENLIRGIKAEAARRNLAGDENDR